MAVLSDLGTTQFTEVAYGNAVAGVALLGAAVAMWLWSRHPRGPPPNVARLAPLLIVFMVSDASAYLGLFVALLLGSTRLLVTAQMVQAAAVIGTGLTVAAMLLRLVRGPSTVELQKANDELRSAKAELEAIRASLEQQVADRTRALTQANRMFEESLQGSNVAVFRQDDQLRFTWLANPNLVMGTGSLIGKSDYDMEQPSDEIRRMIAEKREVLATGIPKHTFTLMETPAGNRWFDVVLNRIQDVDGRRWCVTGTATEISEIKDQEQAQAALAVEFRHRMKNMLGNVMSITNQTIRSMGVDKEFSKLLLQRLNAFADAADLTGRDGADIAALAHKQMGAIIASFPNRVRLVGEPFMLKPNTAQFIALAIHELATNAVKYGALSNDDGYVTLTWSSGPEDGDLVVQWMECNGPTVDGGGKGFGRALLETVVPKVVKGTATYVFAPEGVTWTLTVPGHAPPQRRTA